LVHNFIDNNGDGVDDNKLCNAINTDPAVLPGTTTKPTPDAVQLSAVTAWGDPLETGTDSSAEPSIAGWGCVFGTSTTIPVAQCSSPTDLPFILSHGASKTIAVIYAKNPTNSAALSCTGTTYQLPIASAYGWICAAAVASDAAGIASGDGTIGNMGVSPPIRLCYQSDPQQPLSCNTATLPTCTDGCTPYDPFADTPPLAYVAAMPRIIGQPTN
jgi:hypothetical protein